MLTYYSGAGVHGTFIDGKNGAAIVEAPMNGDTGLDFEMMEALFFAYRDFISSADRDLAGLGFGRAHHRVLHFVNRDPGLTVAQLLEPLAITKQSLARVLKQLVDADLIVQRTHGDDRRQRHLYPTERGRALTLELAAPQSRRIQRAISALGDGGDANDARALVHCFLHAMRDGDGAEREEVAMPATPNRDADTARDGSAS